MASQGGPGSDLQALCLSLSLALPPPACLRLSLLQRWPGQPVCVCIYVHNQGSAARPLAFICIITISVQAHRIVCGLHLLLPPLSRATRLDWQIRFPWNWLSRAAQAAGPTQRKAPPHEQGHPLRPACPNQGTPSPDPTPPQDITP